METGGGDGEGADGNWRRGWRRVVETGGGDGGGDGWWKRVAVTGGGWKLGVETGDGDGGVETGGGWRRERMRWSGW